MRAVAGGKAPPPGFPERHIMDFFMTGLRRRRSARSGHDPAHASGEQLCRDYDVRGFLYFLILCFGGLRACEPLHLFLADITYDFVRGTGALIHLWHPSTGGLPWGGGHWGSRKAYLVEEFGLAPRNEIIGHARAGWKNLLLDESDPPHGQHSRVYWVVPEVGLLFWHLHGVYVAHVRPRLQTHPYYFQSTWGAAYGSPWALDAAGDTFDRALRAIGLEPTSARGLCMHAFRHRIVHWMRLRGVPPEVRRLVLHHQSIESQDSYGQPGPADVSAILRAATAEQFGKVVTYADMFPLAEQSSRLDEIGRKLAANFLGRV